MSVYRMYDSAGAALYVGITNRGARRLGEHGRRVAWWPEVARVEVEHHATRLEAMAREQALIAAEQPRHNTRLRGRPPAVAALEETVDADRMLRVPEVARIALVNDDTVRRWLRTGRLKGVLPGGDRSGWRVWESDLRAFLHKNGRSHD